MFGVNDSSIPQKLANVAVGGTWITWYFSHLEQINAVLQNVALLAAIVSSVLAARFYAKRTGKK